MELPPTKLKLHGVYEGMVRTLDYSLKKLYKSVNLGWENVPMKMVFQPIEIGSMLLQMCVPTSNYSHGKKRKRNVDWQWNYAYDKIAHSMLQVKFLNIFIILANELIKSFAKSIVLIWKPNLLGSSPLYVLIRINLQN